MKTLQNYAPPKQKMLWPEPSKPDYWAIAKDTIFIVVCLMALLSVYSWRMMCDADDRAESHAKVAVAMLNGHTLHDNESGTAYFFDKPVVIEIGIKGQQSAAGAFLNAATKALAK